MPADTSARYYTWFREEDPSARTVALEWWPEGEFASSMTLGTLYLKKRDTPDDVWSPPIRMGGAGETMWVVAEKIARNEGCCVEVANH